MRRYGQIIREFLYGLIGVALVAMILGLSGCASAPKYVPVESVRTDSVYMYRHTTDTVLAKDSILIERMGDTVREVRYLWRYKVRERTDTSYVERTDTVCVPVPVERQLTPWEQAKQEAGGVAIGCVLAVIVAAVVWLIKKLKRH